MRRVYEWGPECLHKKVPLPLRDRLSDLVWQPCDERVHRLYVAARAAMQR